MILILGGGFGLYGHAAALVAEGHKVAGLTKHRPMVQGRLELTAVADALKWYDDESEALSVASGLVLARRPADNATIAQALGGHYEMLVIEKPIAPTPQAALALIDQLETRGQTFSTPYLFLSCAWSDAVARALTRAAEVSIDWAHARSPQVRAWKGDDSAGGGAAFYWIHFLALFEAWLPRARLWALPDAKGIELAAEGTNGRLTCRFGLRDDSRFEVLINQQAHYQAESPFGSSAKPGHPDPRLPSLIQYYRSLAQDNPQPAQFHRGIATKWAFISA